MKKLSSMALALALAAMLSGCMIANPMINRSMSRWQGRHYSELLMGLGPPQSVYDDGSGGRLLVWTKTRRWTTPGSVTTTASGTATVWDNMIWGQAQSYSSYTPPQTRGYTSWRMYRIDQSGRVTGWSWQGL